MNIPSVSVKQLNKLLPITLKNNYVPFIHGKSGIGKSDIIKDYAKHNKLELIDIRLGQYESLDLNGLPMVSNESTTFTHLPLELFPLENTKIPKGKNGWLIFFDEFTHALPDVQNAAYKILLDRAINNAKLHPDVKIVCAGNLMEENSSLYALSSPLISRMVHYYLETTVEDWGKWALEHNVNPFIITTVKNNPNLLHNAKLETEENTPYANPRTWSMLSKQIENMTKKEIIYSEALVVGTIGIASSVPFYELLEFSKVVPDIQKILKGKLVNNTPDEEPSLIMLIQEILLSNLKAKYSDKRATNAFNFIKEYNNEYIFLYIKSFKDSINTSTSIKAIDKWVIKHSELLLG